MANAESQCLFIGEKIDGLKSFEWKSIYLSPDCSKRTKAVLQKLKMDWKLKKCNLANTGNWFWLVRNIG